MCLYKQQSLDFLKKILYNIYRKKANGSSLGCAEWFESMNANVRLIACKVQNSHPKYCHLLHCGGAVRGTATPRSEQRLTESAGHLAHRGGKNWANIANSQSPEHKGIWNGKLRVTRQDAPRVISVSTAVSVGIYTV